MASPQIENGYTRIANEILEALCKYRFPPKASLPMRLVLVVIRKTYGFNKKVDIISLSQFQKNTGENNRTNTVYWLNYLVQAKILSKQVISKYQVEYGLNKDYDQWLPIVQVQSLVQVRKWSSASTGTKTSASTGTHKRKKETITKEREATPAQESQFFFEEGEIYTQLLDQFSKGRDRPRIEKEFKKFILYWTEKNKSGTRERWQQQDTFEVKKRLYTWLSRSNDFGEKITKKTTNVLFS